MFSGFKKVELFSEDGEHKIFDKYEAISMSYLTYRIYINCL